MDFEKLKESKRPIENLLNVEVETERLKLKPVSLEYKDMIFSAFTDEVTKFMFPSTPKQIEDTEKFIKDSIDEMEKGINFLISIFNKETNEFLGGGGIHDLNTKTPGLGIWIKKSAHGNKYGREAITGLKEWADKNLDYEYLLYPVVKENIASRKIPESLGGKVVREFIKKKQNGEDMELVEYRIYK
ncbi:MAG TPA: GNAT family N-acetyltransferase [Candidatus Moranbacteria bacterium]|nr:GNAT family N-acetyltransferase [Candidatus Moranbacteria bacterium]HRZ33858.1 GNAT family N-acetyltransferase [Candidatus Moranbacteria bacterium]